MTKNDMRDPILRLLSRLPPAAPAAVLDERVRARCHLVLEQRQRRSSRRDDRVIIPVGLINATLALTAALYAAAVALEALRLLSPWP